jgi:hypothetical protein
MKCFVSRSFRRKDEKICNWFKELLRGFGDLELIEAGRHPHPVKEQVDRLIRECDLLCAIVTSRKGAIPQWITYEVTRAHDRGIPILIFLEVGISDLGSLETMGAYIKFKRRNLGLKAPQYVAYVCAGRRIAREQRGESRPTLLKLIRELEFDLQVEEDLRNRMDDPEIDDNDADERDAESEHGNGSKVDHDGFGDDGE